MPGKRQPRIGKEQYRILQVLWEQGQSTARQITEELSRSAPVAHSTVQTLLRQLESKGAVGHTAEDRTFIYRPLIQPDEVASTPLHDLVTRLYHGSAYNLMSHLLKHERITPEELAKLRQLLEEESKK